MKLTAPCVFGSLLAFLSLSWIKADEEVVLKGHGFGPCIATLRPERACSPGQDDATCPYLLYLPPLTVNLPPQFQELERIMQDLQKLKESVDELREMCANCTVSQIGGESGRQRSEHEKIPAGKGTREDERNWVRVTFEENDGNFREERRKEKKTKKPYEDNTDDWLIQEGMEDPKSEADKISDKKEIKEKETIKKDTRIYDTSQSEEEKYTQKYTETKETNGINVSVNQEYWEDTFGDGVKVNKNNEKPEQTELTENERTLKERGLDEKSRTIGKEIKTKRGNGVEDGELFSSKTTKRADFVSISPTPQVKMRTAPRAGLIDLRKVKTFTSSLPLPPFPSFTLSSNTDVSQSTADGHGPTQSTGSNTASVPGPRSFDADLTTDMSTTTTVGGLGLETTPNSASTGKLEGQLQGTFSASTTTPTAFHQTLYMTTSPRAEDDNNWKPKSPSRRPQAEKTANKPDKAQFPVKKNEPLQKEKPSLQKPKANKPKPNKDSTQTKNVKPVQKQFPDISKPSKHQNNSSLDAHKQGQPAESNHEEKDNLTPDQDVELNLKRPLDNLNQKPKTELETDSFEKATPISDEIFFTPHSAPNQTAAWPTQRPVGSINLSKMNQTVKPGLAPKQNQKFQKTSTGQNTKPNKNPKPGQPPKTVSKLKSPRPGQKPPPGFTPIRDKINKPQTNKTSKPRTPVQFRPSTRHTVKPPAETIQKPDPTVQPQLKQKIKSGASPTQSNRISSTIQTMSTTMPSTLGFVKNIAKETNSPVDNNPNFSFKKTITEQTKNQMNSTVVSNDNVLTELNSNPYTPSEEKRSQLVTSTAIWDIKTTHTTSTVHQNPKMIKEVDSATGPASTPKPLEGLREIFDDSLPYEPKSKEESEPKLTPTLVQTIVWPTQRPTVNSTVTETNQTAKLGLTPKKKPTFQKPGTGLNIKTFIKSKPGQPSKTNPKLKTSRPGQKPPPAVTLFRDKLFKSQTNKTSTGNLRPPYRFRPPPRPTMEPQSESNKSLNQAVQPQPKQIIKSGTDQTPISGTSSFAFKNSNTNTSPRSGPAKQVSEMTQSPWDSKYSVSIKTPITQRTRHPITSVKDLDKNIFSDPNSSPDSTSEKKLSELVKTTPYWETTVGQKIPIVHQNPTAKTEFGSTTILTTTIKPPGEVMDKSDDNSTLKPNSEKELLPKLTTSPVRTTAWTTQRPTFSSNFSKMKQTAIPVPAPTSMPKIKKTGTSIHIKTFAKSKPGQPPKLNPKLKPPRPVKMPPPGFTPIEDKIHKAQTNKTSKWKPPFQIRPLIRPTFEPPAQPIQKPDPVVQTKPKLKIKLGAAPTQSSWTSTTIQAMSTTMQPTFGFVKEMSENTHVPLDNNTNASFKKNITEQKNNQIRLTEESNKNILPEPNFNPYTLSEEKRSEIVTATAIWDIKTTQKISIVHQIPKTSKFWKTGASPTSSPKRLEGSKKVSGDNIFHEPKSKEESEPEPTSTPVQTTVWPTQRPAINKNISKLNQTAKLGKDSKQNPKFQRPGTGQNKKTNKIPKSGQPPKTISKLKPSRPGHMPQTGFTPIWDKIHKAQTNKTSKPKASSQFRPPTRPTLKPPAQTVQKPDPTVQPQLKQKIKSEATPTQFSWTSSTIQMMSTTMKSTFGFVKEMTEKTPSTFDNNPKIILKKTITEQPKAQINSTEVSNDKVWTELNTNSYTPSEEKRSQLVTSTAFWEIKPTQKTSTIHQNPKMIKGVESAAGSASTPKPLEGLREISDDNLPYEPKSKEKLEPKMTPTRVQKPIWPTKRPILKGNISKTNQTAKLGLAPKEKPKFQKPGTGIKTFIMSKPGQPPKTSPKLKTSRPGLKPPPGFTPVRDKLFKAQSNKTSNLRLPYGFGPPTKPTLESLLETNKRLNPAAQPEPKQVNKKVIDPTPISWTSSVPFQNTNTNTPQTSTSLKKPNNVEKNPPATIFPSPSSRTTSTIHPDFRSTTPTTPGLDAQTPADSAQELRVKKNQVAAFPNNNQSPNRSPADKHPKQHPKATDGDETITISMESPVTARRDCSDLLLLGEKQSGVYTVTPDPSSRSFSVFCDMELEGGGWTVLQRRLDGSVSFNRTWAEYRSGFGVLDGGEFWLGNNMIHLLTRVLNMELRVELEDFNGVKEYAQYEYFKVASEKLLYKLMVGGYSGTAGDALSFSRMYNHNNMAFTTPDKDNDRYPSGNCGAYYGSGWWFDACMAANLNGKYYVGPYKGVRNGIFWGTWHNISREYYPTNERHTFKTVRMMARPARFKP